MEKAELKITIDLSPSVQQLLKDILMAQSATLTALLALINTISVGSATDPKVTQAITDLQTKLNADETTQADYNTAFTALLNKLANSVPAGGTGTGALPTVTGVSITSDKLAGGTSFTVTGTGFSVSPPTVAINGVAATAIAVASDVSLTGITGAQTSGGTFDLLVTTTAGTSATSAADQIAYTKF